MTNSELKKRILKERVFSYEHETLEHWQSHEDETVSDDVGDIAMDDLYNILDVVKADLLTDLVVRSDSEALRILVNKIVKWFGEAKNGMSFRVGDIVSRDGTDRQEVIEVGEYGEIKVKCVKAPKTRWIKIGEVETNLSRRYFKV